MVKRAYTLVPMDCVSAIRESLKNKLKMLGDHEGSVYSIRTFYIGPRGTTWSGTPQRTTNKNVAIGAKFAIYKLTRGKYGNYNQLIEYL